jgi:hypothetical protein
MGNSDSGACFVYYGGVLLDAVADTLITGDAASVHLGRAVASGGDVRHNGRGTLLVGGYNATDSGRMMLFGSDEMPTAVLDPWLDRDGDGVPDGHRSGLPDRTAELMRPWPNPFNPHVQTNLRLQEAGRWRVTVFDIRGRQVAVLSSGWLSAGEHAVAWDGRGLDGRTQPSGLYLIRAVGSGESHSVIVSMVR